MKMIALLHLFILPYLYSVQDDGKIRQLHSELEQTNEQAVRADILSDISQAYRSSNPKEAIQYGNKAIEAAEKADDVKVLAKAINTTGAGFFMLGDFESAANKYYEALRLRESIGDSVGICLSYNNIGNIYISQHNYTKAEEYYNKALRLANHIKDKTSISRTLNNLGSSSLKQGAYEQALKYYKAALPLKEELEDKPGVIAALSNIGLIYSTAGNYQAALTYQLRALAIADEIQSLHDKTYVLRGLSEAYWVSKDYDKAVYYAKLSLEEAQKLNAKDHIRLSAELLNNIYTTIGDFKNAHAYLTLYSQYNDSVQTEKAMMQISSMQVKYDTELKEKENLQLKTNGNLQAKQLHQKTLIQYGIGTLLAISVLFSIIAYRGSKRLRQINKQLFIKNEQIMAFHHELSEKKKAIVEQSDQLQKQKEELVRLNEVKNKLFSIVAHDLRGPLVSLKSLLQLLSVGALPEDKLRQFAKTLESEQQNTLWLLDNLLIWARSQMEGLNTKANTMHIAALVQENIELLTPQAQRKDITITNKVAPNVAPITMADDEMIKMVLRNLISNAIKFCNAGDSITIETQSTDYFLTVIVQDTGIGIDAKSQEKIFGFRSLTTRGTALEKGSGLGLALCKDFIEQNGGRIWVESEPGVGSSFKFTLPSMGTAQRQMASKLDFLL
ncbi:tetratricopeptide repeat-containing sensor histidine kinase [Pontibacter sp. SGAir0037]|uniref:ATP-binding protein n=1 Tax=Pontibacter sp. SGAir0037 TaxID=2571030 RepID=UPI00143D1764|nr:tetratricopeptide repeat-containing sensor histidine kinase [Pontibacter sp. SGAir0037]